MSVQDFNAAPSRRYIRVYLAFWAVLGLIALGYLTTLAWQPEHTAAAAAKTKVAEPDPGLKAATQALAEINSVRQTVGDLQKNLGDLKETVEQRKDEQKSWQVRVTELEEKVAAIPAQVAGGGNTTATTPATGKAKVVEKPAPKAAEPKTAEKAPPKAAPAKAVQQKAVTPRVITVTEDPPGTVTTTTPTTKRLETGSINQPDIAFGETVVTRAGESFAVQLDVAPSIDVLRMRWGLLVERYGSTLATLQPRFVAPRTPGAPYRLLAGPVSSLADAKEICGELKALLPACSTTDFGGEPL